MPIEHLTLQGTAVVLEAMAVSHAPGLLRAAESPETFRYFRLGAVPFDIAGMEHYCTQLIESPTTLPYVVRDIATGEFVGSTTFCSIREPDRGVEIGWTWYAPSARGTAINPECKRLLLRRAFETDLFPAGPAIRVELKTDARNERSRAAILKLGATFEGVLRQHVIMPDGHLRNSALYSILPDEWPAIDADLARRIDGAQAS
ncbi:MAG: GNAT family protein [Planctomycetota bacterium]